MEHSFDFEYTEAEKRDKAWAQRMKTVFFALLLDLTAFTIILPLFPAIIDHYKKNDTSGMYEKMSMVVSYIGNRIGAPAKYETVLFGGVLGSMFSMLQFMSSPILGAYADIYGRKCILVLCMVGIISSHVLWYFSSTFAMFVLARIIGGLSRSNISICTTLIADDCPDHLRPRGMAYIGIAFSVGFVVGPATGALFAVTKSYEMPALLCVALSFASLLITVFQLDETLDAKNRAKNIEWRQIATYISPFHLFNFNRVSVGRSLRPLGFSYFVYIFFFSGLEFTLTFLTQAKFMFSSADQGKMFTFLGISMAFLQGFVTRRLTPDIEHYAGLLGMLIMVPAFSIIGFANDIGMLSLGLFCYSFGSAVVGPTLTSMLSAKVPEDNERGVAVGTFRSLGALARATGPLFSSFCFWRFGPTLTYAFGAVASLIPLFLLKLAISEDDYEAFLLSQSHKSGTTGKVAAGPKKVVEKGEQSKKQK